MNRAAIQTALDDVFDQALIFHGFTDYMRDYEVITYSVADPRTGIQPSFDRYRFRYCVEASVITTVSADNWRKSLDERLIEYATGVDLDGHVWGVKWQCLYPGGKVLAESPTAERWAEAIGIDFHEVVIEANGHKISLVFSDLEVTSVEPGYAPFIAKADDV
jgi:hypothetical protein